MSVAPGDVDRRPATVLVTGGSRGIGLMIAEAFAAAGARVLISSRTPDACDRAAASLSDVGECVSVPADLTTDAGRAELVRRVGEEADALDVLVNNAGAAWGAPLGEYPPDAFDKVWAINVKAVFALTQDLLPLLRAAASAAAPARVINIGSTDGTRVSKFDNFAYSTSKAGVHMLTQHLAARLASDRITVNAIAAGPFYTDLTAQVLDDEEAAAAVRDRIPLGRIGEPGDIAGLALFLAGPGASWMTGAVIPLDGGLSL
jgi:NAD(P)-dependent dehydrogenase (short-subunit alcohol dehydrogenase family)